MPQDSLIGQRLGAYQIKSAIGEGGMARVYQAYHERLQRDVALKVILPHLLDQGQKSNEAEFIERFKREALLVARLEHPNIVSVYDFGEANADEQGNRLTYLVMQYVGGGTLRSYMRDGQPLDPRRAARYTLQMARALHHAHRHGIVHRDIKPQNMLVSSSDPNHLLLSDFGIAKLFSTNEDTPRTQHTQPNAHPALTQVGQVVGTAAYMAPEQFNNQQVDARTDIYALGVVLYQMLAGQRPFQSENFTGFLYQHMFQPPPSIRATNPQVPEVLALIAYRALEKLPERRFQNAEEMAQALEDALPLLAHPSSASSQFPYIDSSAQTLPSQPSARPTRPNYSTIEAIPSAPIAQGQTSFHQSGTTPITTPGSLPQANPYLASSLAQPTRRRSPLFRISAIISAIIIVLALVLAGANLLPLLGLNLPGSPAPSTSTTHAFTDTFASNDNQWIVGNFDALTASITNHIYQVVVNDANTHFPNPQAIGRLSPNFTWTVKMRQESGSLDRLYGIAFCLTYANQSIRSGYVFAIDGQGDYTILRYDSDGGRITYQALWSAQANTTLLHRGLHQSNTLQVAVSGSTFTFSLNDLPVHLQDNATHLTDNHYSGGSIGLMVTGADSPDDTAGKPGFAITFAQLTLN